MSKFRVFDKQEKKYVKGLFIDENGNIYTLRRIDFDIKASEELDPDRYVVEFSTDAFEFDENRKQGKEMFQGDVVRCDCFESHEIYIVEIDNFKRLPDEMTGSKCNSRQIIGNIHGDENGKA
jgi:hypothetical protein